LLAVEDKNIGIGYNFSDQGGGMFRAEWPSKAMRDQLKAIIHGLNTPTRSDSILTELLLPEIVACIEGVETPESAATKLFSKLSAYRSE
jgi:hypothetical protein